MYINIGNSAADYRKITCILNVAEIMKLSNCYKWSLRRYLTCYSEYWVWRYFLVVFRKSCIMGWRLFAIVACYCDCTESLRPYLFKYLETTASDPSRTYSGAASICLQNLRKTFKYGGRKNVPHEEEIRALAVSS